MRFELSADQKAIQEAARTFLAARSGPARVRELAEDGRYDDPAWAEMRELGWTALAVPEEHGGLGLGVLELAVLAEELGWALTPSPLLPSAAAALVIARAGSPEQQAEWLPALATGEATGTLGIAAGDDAVVPDGAEADVVVLVAEDRARLVPRAEAQAEPLEALDHTRRFARVRGTGEPLPGNAAPGLDAAVIALAAECTGVAARVLRMSVEYATDRRQYGRPIGSFQAVSHRCADMYLETEGARSLVYAAAWAADHDLARLPFAAAAAKAYAADAACRVTAAGLQVHGGIGFSWEHDLHFFLKRARANAAWLGGAAHHRERAAALSGLPAGAAAAP